MSAFKQIIKEEKEPDILFKTGDHFLNQHQKVLFP